MDERFNAVELFGYDFMIDETFNTWILEINKSPSMDTNTVFYIILEYNQRFGSRFIRRYC